MVARPYFLSVRLSEREWNRYVRVLEKLEIVLIYDEEFEDRSKTFRDLLLHLDSMPGPYDI